MPEHLKRGNVKKSKLLELATLAGIQIPSKQAEDRLYVFATYLAQEGRKEREAKVVKVKGVRFEEWVKNELIKDCGGAGAEDVLKFFSETPEEVMPNTAQITWVLRRGAMDDKMWGAWTKFYNHFTSEDCKKPLKKNWSKTWINFITKG